MECLIAKPNGTGRSGVEMDKPTIEIPQDRWQTYFEGLSELYHGWRVTIEVLAGKLGDQRAADWLPLQGLSYESKGSEAGDITVEVGDLPFAFMIHHVDQARSVRVTESQPGEEADLFLEAADGTVTLVRIRPNPELPPSAPPSPEASATR